MSVSTPHVLLFAEADSAKGPGRWQFTIETADGSGRLEVEDVEPDTSGERLLLLAVVRGLEALDQPSEVSLVGCRTFIRNGMQYGLNEWRSNGWRWERFGQMVPVKNGDLWQRMDRALRFHRVECRRRVDPAHTKPAPARSDSIGARDQRVTETPVAVREDNRKPSPPEQFDAWSRSMEAVKRCWRKIVQAWTAVSRSEPGSTSRVNASKT